MQFFAITFLSLCLAAISTSAAPAPVSNFTPDASTLTQHSKRIGLPHEICMDTLGKASHRLAVDVYPTFKTQGRSFRAFEPVPQINPYFQSLRQGSST